MFESTSTLSRFFLLGLLCVTALVFNTRSSLAKNPLVMTISNGEASITGGSWAIGDDLYVSLAGPPSTLFTVELIDHQETVILSTTAQSDSTGLVAPFMLWFRSGVVGCDVPEDIDPSQARYEDFEQADLFLGGQPFVVKARESSGSQSATRHLTALPDPDSRIFFSDLHGCPRSLYGSSESIFLSGRHFSSDPFEVALFLVSQENPISPPNHILEVRQEWLLVPQSFPPVPLTILWTRQVWSGRNSQVGNYAAILRQFTGTTDYILHPDDQLLGLPEGRNPHGATIHEGDCTDPCCDG